MRISVLIKNRTKGRALTSKARTFVHRALRALAKEQNLTFLRRHEILVSLSLVSNSEIKKINRKYRRKNKFTNVLSFPTYPSRIELARVKTHQLDLGDIIVAPAVVTREAQDAEISFYQQFFWAILHGILHVLGFDHEVGRRAQKEMFDLEKRILRRTVR